MIVHSDLSGFDLKTDTVKIKNTDEKHYFLTYSLGEIDTSLNSTPY
jgi:hypothetical protein